MKAGGVQPHPGWRSDPLLGWSIQTTEPGSGAQYLREIPARFVIQQGTDLGVCLYPFTSLGNTPLAGNLPLGMFPFCHLFHHLGFILFGLDFFQLISLVDLTHSPCTMSMKSRPASCPSRRICKYGPLSLH